MAKPERRPREGEPVIKAICRNRRAAFDYELLEVIECGVVLVGTEVKTLRQGHASLEDSYASVDARGELWLIGCEIPEYHFGNRQNHKPKRERKLLLRRREITKFAEGADQRGFTLIPTRMYFKDGLVKVAVAIGKGKQAHDKRQSLKNKEANREIDRALSQRRRR